MTLPQNASNYGSQWPIRHLKTTYQSCKHTTTPTLTPQSISSILRDWIPWFSSLPEAMGLGGWFKFPFVRSWTAKRGLCWNSFFHQNFSSREIFSLRNCPSVLNLCLKSRGKPEGKRSQLSIWNMCFNIAPTYFSASNTVYFSTSPLDTIYLAA